MITTILQRFNGKVSAPCYGIHWVSGNRERRREAVENPPPIRRRNGYPESEQVGSTGHGAAEGSIGPGRGRHALPEGTIPKETEPLAQIRGENNPASRRRADKERPELFVAPQPFQHQEEGRLGS